MSKKLGDLETRIKDLERQLTLKKAYLNININFGRGNNIPEDIKEEVENKIKDFCTKMAEDQEYSRIETESVIKSEVFSEEEILILKEVASTIIKKSQIIKKEKQILGKTAILMTTESIPRERRAKLSSLDEVRIINLNKKEASIITKENERFVVPLEDLQLKE